MAGLIWRFCSRTVQVAPQPCLKYPCSKKEAMLTALGGQAAGFWVEFMQHLAQVKIFGFSLQLGSTLLQYYYSGTVVRFLLKTLESQPIPSSTCAVSYRWFGSVPQIGPDFGWSWANTWRFITLQKIWLRWEKESLQISPWQDCALPYVLVFTLEAALQE